MEEQKTKKQFKIKLVPILLIIIGLLLSFSLYQTVSLKLESMKNMLIIHYSFNLNKNNLQIDWHFRNKLL